MEHPKRRKPLTKKPLEALYNGFNDQQLEDMWHRFGDVPMNPETECIEQPFMHWTEGTHREEIWHWFDERHSKGVYYLLYGGQYHGT